MAEFAEERDRHRGSGRPRDGGSRSPRASRVSVFLVRHGPNVPPGPQATLKRTSHGDVLVERTELRSRKPNPVTVGDVLVDLDTARLPLPEEVGETLVQLGPHSHRHDEYAASRMSYGERRSDRRPAAAERAPCERAPPGTGRRLRGRPQRRALRPCLGGTPSCHRSRRVRARPRSRSGRRSIRAAISAWIVEGSG